MERYLSALLLVGFSIFVLLIVNSVLKKRIKKLEQQNVETMSRTSLRSLPLLRFFQRIALPLSFLGILSVAVNLIEFDERIQTTVQAVFAVIMTIIIVRSINKGIELSFSRHFEKEWANHEQEKNLKPLLALLKFVLWIFGFIFLLGNLGFDVSTAVAGLGVGGIAVAIAAQGILGDLFSYFVIFLDKPFELGDFIIFGDKMGIVERIGIKSSRIRVLSGEVLVISNSDLTSSRIHNYKQMKRRRVVFTVNVTYQTLQEHVEEIPSIIRGVIESIEVIKGVECDRCHLQSLAAYSLVYEAIYYVPSPDYKVYMDVQQEIYQRLYRIFNERGIEFAYPTQVVYPIHKQESEVLPAVESAPQGTEA